MKIRLKKTFALRNRLRIGFASIITIIVIMSGISFWSNWYINKTQKKFTNAQREVANAIKLTKLTEECLTELNHSVSQQNLLLRTFYENLLQNKKQIGVFDPSDDPLTTFLDKSVDQYSPILGEQFLKTIENMQQTQQNILKLEAKVQKTWRARHEGLSEELNP